MRARETHDYCLPRLLILHGLVAASSRLLFFLSFFPHSRVSYLVISAQGSSSLMLRRCSLIDALSSSRMDGCSWVSDPFINISQLKEQRACRS